MLKGGENNEMTNLLTELQHTAEAYPDKLAVADALTRFSFRELWELAARLGSALLRLQPQAHPVGVLVARSAYTVAELFSVLYAGLPYVPLDPDMPLAKLQTILADAEITVLMGSSSDAIEVQTQWNYPAV